MCDVTLATTEERTAHFKSAWHMCAQTHLSCRADRERRFNLKLKISGQSVVSEKEVSELQSAGGAQRAG